MGNSLYRQFVKFTNQRIRTNTKYRKHGRYYLSEIMCEWVWGSEGHDIYKWAKDEELITDEDYRSVIDMIRLCKRLRKHRSNPEFTNEERERYLLFINARRKRKIGSHTIYIAINHRDGKTYEYLTIPTIE